jgi:hypothetical protein
VGHLEGEIGKIDKERREGRKRHGVVERSSRSEHDGQDDVGLWCVLRICGWRKNPCRVLICHQTACYYRSAGSRCLFFLCDIRIIMETIYGNNNQDYAACRIGHTAVRLGGLAAVVKDAHRVGLKSGSLSLASGGVSCFDGCPFWDLVQGLG